MDVTKIGNKIRERRTALNMTQKDLAQKLNISNQLISKWETGESLPSLEYLDPLCNALEVDFSFFTKDDDKISAVPSAPIEPQAAPLPDEKQKPKRKVNLLLIVILCTCVLAATFIAGITLLTCFVIVPAANKQSYIQEMDNSLDNYFSHGYYNIVRKLQIDGDDEDDVVYKGIIGEDGKITFYNSEDGITYADGVITADNENMKYRAEIPEHVKTLEDLVKWQIFDDEEDDFDLEYIRRIRRTGKGFYIEMSEEYLTEDMDGSIKKNIKFLDKIKGEVIIENGVCSSISVTVKYRNTVNNENFTIVTGFEFKEGKPVIAHTNLEGRQWGYGYYDYAPKCDNLVTQAEFMANLGATKAVSQSTELGEAVANNKIGYAEGYIYCWQDNEITLYNSDDLSLINTYTFNNTVENVYIYGNNLYFREKTTLFDNEFNAINLTDGTERNAYDKFYNYNVNYSGKYCWFNTMDGYRVLDLSDNTLHYKDDTSLITVIHVDNAGNVYTEMIVEDKLKVFYGGKGEGVILKGNSYLYFMNENVVYTRGYTNDYFYEYYRYENGVLKETIDQKSYDPRIVGTYNATLGGYYCYSNPISVHNQDGSYKDAFTAIKLYTDNGENEACISVSVLSTFEDKTIINMANRTDNSTYAALYSATDFATPVCYMKLIDDRSSAMKIFNAGDKAVISVKQADGSYSVWIA